MNYVLEHGYIQIALMVIWISMSIYLLRPLFLEDKWRRELIKKIKRRPSTMVIIPSPDPDPIQVARPTYPTSGGQKRGSREQQRGAILAVGGYDAWQSGKGGTGNGTAWHNRYGYYQGATLVRPILSTNRNTINPDKPPAKPGRLVQR